MRDEYTGARVERRAFKDGLIDLTATLMQVDHEWFQYVCANRDWKEEPMESLGGRSPRQALMYVSEEVIKPNFGEDYFGRYAAQRLTPDRLHIFSDGGFVQEILPLIDMVGQENFFLVQLAREGCTFEGDSRRYIPLELADNHTILLNDKLDRTKCELAHRLSCWIGGGNALSPLWH
jgi:hypothetical protein